MKAFPQIALILAMLPCTDAFAAEHFVEARPDFTFFPKHLVIVEGDTVTWTNTGGFHNVAATDSSFRCAEDCGAGGGPSPAAWSFSLVFTELGRVDYVCEAHATLGMTGSVTVNADPTKIFTDGFESGSCSAWSSAVGGC